MWSDAIIKYYIYKLYIIIFIHTNAIIYIPKCVVKINYIFKVHSSRAYEEDLF